MSGGYRFGSDAVGATIELERCKMGSPQTDAVPFEATVLDVVMLPRAGLASVRYYTDRHEINSALVMPQTWGTAYWPPSPGDIISVRPRQVTLVLRPRKGATP